MSNYTNIVRIKAVANILNQLNEEFVFVGGATVSLYGDESKAEARPTDDVDVIIELASYTGYAELDENLRKLGFENDMESGVLCRYRVKGIIVDVMPTDASVIGFSNRWYADGFKFAKTIQLDYLPMLAH
jgi:predicted nucleotidyltransferase